MNKNKKTLIFEDKQEYKFSLNKFKIHAKNINLNMKWVELKQRKYNEDEKVEIINQKFGMCNGFPILPEYCEKIS